MRSLQGAQAQVVICLLEEHWPKDVVYGSFTTLLQYARHGFSAGRHAVIGSYDQANSAKFAPINLIFIAGYEMNVNQLSVFIENCPGSLAALTGLLRDNNIDLRALSLADVEDYGILRIIVNDVHKTSVVLKNANYVFKITPVLAVPLKDTPGSLADVLAILGNANINVEYLYAFVGRQAGRAYVIFRVRDADLNQASQTLGNTGYAPVSQEDLDKEK